MTEKMIAADKAKLCERVYRSLQSIGPASATAVSHRAAVGLAAAIGVLREMEARGAVRATYDKTQNGPEMWSVVARKGEPR